MQKKRLFSAALTMVTTTVILLSGCGATSETSVMEEGQSTTSTIESASTPTASSTEEAKSEKVHITYAQWGNETETAATQAVADKFNQSQDEIEVEVIKIDHDIYVTKLNAMATAGELPDTAIMSEAGVLKFAENGLLADISSMYGEGDSKPLDSITFKYQGTPVAYSAANEVLNLWYNIDLLEEVCTAQGLDISEFTPPASADDAWDWDTFVKVAQTLTVDINGNNALSPDFDPSNVDIYGCTVNTLPWQLEVWAKSNGGGYFSADGSACTINDAATVEALQKIADLSEVYHCAPPVTSAANALESSLGSKKVVMATDGTWNVGTFLGPSADFRYGVGVLPYMKEKVTICTGGPNVVFATTEHPEEAMTWLKWYYQEENSWSLIEAGTWMPILDKWYTDAEYTDKWIKNPNYPEYEMYKNAVVEYAKNNSQSTAWYYVNATDEFNATLDSAFSAVWSGDQTMQEAIDEYYEELNDIFSSNN
ncbi:MAG: sugar ABC transporter substrate-binding protein [Butyrivibrio sp.]|uniref:ABC transporter substrate-binding protein n=1 Tax=Butyrivibrio sp. TaxID=28121 RepID=UPI0025B80C1B|nr:sugar ABC transporter substrate-binding protein [Butyrivibrio sp.]MBQ6587645.1 sugar ABC transporter substrate-binding protein [Butyrivibrio sp.]